MKKPSCQQYTVILWTMASVIVILLMLLYLYRSPNGSTETYISGTGEDDACQVACNTIGNNFVVSGDGDVVDCYSACLAARDQRPTVRSTRPVNTANNNINNIVPAPSKPVVKLALGKCFLGNSEPEATAKKSGIPEKVYEPQSPDLMNIELQLIDENIVGNVYAFAFLVKVLSPSADKEPRIFQPEYSLATKTVQASTKIYNLDKPSQKGHFYISWRNLDNVACGPVINSINAVPRFPETAYNLYVCQPKGEFVLEKYGTMLRQGIKNPFTPEFANFNFNATNPTSRYNVLRFQSMADSNGNFVFKHNDVLVLTIAPGQGQKNTLEKYKECIRDSFGDIYFAAGYMHHICPVKKVVDARFSTSKKNKLDSSM